MDALLVTKLYIPPPQPDMVTRPRLTERLDAALANKLTLVSAPAGYGKTTLIKDWVHRLERSVGWLSLDSWDDDPLLFLRYFMEALQHAALQQGIDGFGQIIKGALKSTPPPSIPSVVVSMINAIETLSDPLVIILDDFHVIQDIKIHEVIRFLLERQSPQMHLVIITREDPPLLLSRLRAQGELIEIRARDLRFTQQEATSFLNEAKGLGLTVDEVATVESQTEGWITGLQLAAHSLKGESDRGRFIRTFAGDNRRVVDYLTDEVLARLPEEVRQFLLKTAVLERLCASLSQAVVYGDGVPEPPVSGSRGHLHRAADAVQVGARESQRILEWLEQANLFTVPLDKRREWYRYHHLFADLLRYRLELESPGGTAELHERASAWYEREGLITDAIQHATAGGRFERVASLIEEHGFKVLFRGEVHTLQGWLGTLPEEMMRRQPLLCVYVAWSLLFADFTAPPPTVEEWLEEAERVLSSQAEDADEQERIFQRHVLGNIATIRAYLALALGKEPQVVMGLSTQALDSLSEGEAGLRSALHHNIAAAYLALQDVAAADRSCDNALREGLASGAHYIVAGTYYVWAMIAKRQGRLRDAAETCRQGLKAVTAASDGGTPQPPSAGLLYLVLGGILLEWGDLEAAEDALTKAMEMIELTAEKESLAVGHATLAHLYQAQGKSARAHDAIQKIEALVPQAAAYGAALRAHLQLREAERDPGQLQAALRWSRECALELNGEQDLPAILSLGEWPYAEQLTLARLRIAQARGMNAPAEQATLQSVLDYLEAQIRIAAARGWNERVIVMTVLKALALDAQGDTEGAIESLRGALTMGEAEGYLRLFVDEGVSMGRLLYKALSGNILPEYVGKLLAAFSDAQPAPFISTESSTPSRRAGRKQLDEPVEPLSEREIEVLELISHGFSNREVAQRLSISLNTVKGHTTNIYGKLGVASRTQATAKARMIGLLQPG